MKQPKHEARGNSVYVGRIEVARFNDHYAARRFADFANTPKSEREKGTAHETPFKGRG